VTPGAARALLASALAAGLVGASPAAAAPAVPKDRVRAVLTWSPVAGASQYELELADDPAFSRVVERAAAIRPRFTWYTVTNEAHYLRVRGVGRDGRSSPWSAPRLIELRLDPPVATHPPPGTRHPASGPPPVLQAEPSRFMAAYRFQVARELGFKGPVVDQVTKEPRLALQRPLAPGRWYWRVGGNDDFGNDLPFSPAVPLEVTQAPAAPRPAPRPARPPPAIVLPPPAAEPEPEPAPALPPGPAPAPEAAVEPPPAPPRRAEVPLPPPPSLDRFEWGLGLGARSRLSGASPLTAAADATWWPGWSGRRFGLCARTELWTASWRPGQLPGVAEVSRATAFTATLGPSGQAQLGALRLSGGLLAGARLASWPGASGWSTGPVAGALAGLSLARGAGRVGLELQLETGRWSPAGRAEQVTTLALLASWHAVAR
jgi:hypothetical protein